MLSLDRYLEDPCRRASIPYWKTQRVTLPEDMRIVHEEEFRKADYPGWTDTPFFRLHCRLDVVERVAVPGIELIPASEEHSALIAELINRSYTDLSVTEQQVRNFTRSPAYHPALWLLAVCGESGEAVGCAIGEYDRESGEATLEWVQVLPRWRRQGVGRLMVSGLLLRMKEFAAFATVSGKQNDPTRPEMLYRACGFTGNDVWHILKR